MGRGKQFERKTNILCNSILHYDFKKNQFRKRIADDEDLKKTTDALNEKKKEINKSLTQAVKENIPINSIWLKKEIEAPFHWSKDHRTDEKLTTIIEEIIESAPFRQVVGRKNLGLSQSTIKAYQTFHTLIRTYEEKEKGGAHWYFSQLTERELNEFRQWLLETKKYSKNYAGKSFDHLKTICNEAKKHGIKPHPNHSSIKGFQENDEDRFIITLSIEELENIAITEMPNEYLRNAKKWILLGCEIGQRGNDLLSITPSQIREKSGEYYIDIKQKKGKKSVTVPIINDHTKEIIRTGFPTKIALQNLNDYTKEVCKIAGINELTEGKVKGENNRFIVGFYPKFRLIASHAFRRSFATMYYGEIPNEKIMEITGHTREATFLKYIGKTKDSDEKADDFRVLARKTQEKKQRPKLKIAK